MSVQLCLKEGSLVFEDNGSYLQDCQLYKYSQAVIQPFPINHSVLQFTSAATPHQGCSPGHTLSSCLVNPYVHASLSVSWVLFPAAPIASVLHTLSHRFGDDCLLLLLPGYSACACPYGENPAPTETHTKAPDNGANLFIPLHYLMRNIKQLICC